MKQTLFMKSEENDKKRFWFSVSTEYKDGTIAKASITVRLSDAAYNAIKDRLQTTKNPTVKFAKIKFSDGDFWFIPFVCGTVNRVGIFINKCEVDNSTQKTL